MIDKAGSVEYFALIFCAAFRAFLVTLFFFAQLLSQVTFTVTMQLWFIAVFAEIGRNIGLIDVKFEHHQVTARQLAKPEQQEEGRDQVFPHFAIVSVFPRKGSDKILLQNMIVVIPSHMALLDVPTYDIN